MKKSIATFIAAALLISAARAQNPAPAPPAAAPAQAAKTPKPHDPAKEAAKAAEKAEKAAEKKESATVVGKDIEYKEGDTILQGYLAYDTAHTVKKSGKPAKLPGVLIVHQWKGLGEYEKKRARMLAELGYVAFAVDVYGKGIRPATAEEAGKQSGIYKADRALLRKRLKAGLDILEHDAMVNSSELAAIGYCFGGMAALELARSGAALEGVVSFHGVLDAPTPAKPGEIKAKVLVLHGADDPHVPADQVAGFQKEMRDAGADWQFVAYGGAVHSFTEKEAGNDPKAGAAYNEKADKRSWSLMKDFLREVFKQDKNDKDKNDKPHDGAKADAKKPAVPAPAPANP